MNTLQKGDIAEQRVISRALDKGFIVLRPINSGTRYDMIIDDGEFLQKVQVKWGEKDRPSATRVYRLSLESANAPGRTKSAVRTYAEGEIDCVIAFIAEEEAIVRIPAPMIIGKRSVKVRFEDTANGQVNGVIHAKDYSW